MQGDFTRLHNGLAGINYTRAKLAREPQTHACVLCDKQTSISRPVCPTCAKGLD